MSVRVGYHWHLRRLMAEAGMFATTDLVPLLAERGVKLSREQVYRLVAQRPERLSLATLAALCDILDVGVEELIEITAASTQVPKTVGETPVTAPPVRRTIIRRPPGSSVPRPPRRPPPHDPNTPLSSY